MRSVLNMAVKDLVLVRRDWLGLFFIIGFPILMGIFFGAMYGGMGESGSSGLELAVVDEDKSAMSAKFVESLNNAENIAVKKLSRDEAIDRVRRGDLVGMVVVPAGFGETAGMPWTEGPAIQLGVDPSRKAEAAMLHGLIMQAAGKLMLDRFQDPRSMRPQIDDARNKIASSNELATDTRTRLSALMTSVDGLLEVLEDVQAADSGNREESPAGSAGANDADSAVSFQLARIETLDVTRQPRKGSSEELMSRLRSPWDISFPQSMMWGVLGCAAAFAITIVRERKQGTLLRLQAAPISRAHVIFGKALACFFAVIGVIIVMIALGAWLGMRPRSPALLAVASVCVAFSFVGIMILMSVIGKSEEAVSGAAWGANMLMAMFGGGMIPLAFMPKFMVPLSQFSPVKWSVLSLEGAIWRGFSPSEMIGPCAVLVAVGAACLALGAVRLARMTD